MLYVLCTVSLLVLYKFVIELFSVFYTRDNIVILEDWTSKCSESLTEIQSQIVLAQIKKTQRVTQNQQTETEVPLVLLAVHTNETFIVHTCCSCYPSFNQVPVQISRQEFDPMKQRKKGVRLIGIASFIIVQCSTALMRK